MNQIVIDPQPCHRLSPYLHTQFMEPLGTTDGSVEAAWNHQISDWRADVVEVTRALAPRCIRWGGIVSSYYKWREGVGPRCRRVPMHNYLWGGIESNQVGTREFVDFCRRTGADPLICVNFLSDGRPEYLHTTCGENRSGDSGEAADWVSYCNDPDNAERKRNGQKNPLNVNLWQIGNETSYHPKGFTLNETLQHTIEFAKAMKARDASIRVIGWGDRDRAGQLWAPRLLTEAGEYIDFVAMHMMHLKPTSKDTVLRGFDYRLQPDRAWNELMSIYDTVEPRLQRMVEAVKSYGNGHGIAITEGHLSIPPHNCNTILAEWQAGLFHARVANLYQRHGKFVRLATLADFCGTRWTVNALMIPVPDGRARSYLMPAGSIMKLYGAHSGCDAITVLRHPASLDIAASRTGNQLFLHVVNTNIRSFEDAELIVDGYRLLSGRVHEVAPANLAVAVTELEPGIFEPRERALDFSAGAWCRFPKASVSVVALDIASTTADRDLS